MILIAFFVALYGLASLCEGLEILFDALHAVMTSYSGTVITVIVVAWMTYRWYRARHSVDTDV